MTLTVTLTLTLNLSLLRTYPCGAHRSAAAALLARTAHPPVLADAVATALLHTLRCRPCSQPAARGCRRRILCKPRCRTCSQMLLLPHSLQSLRRLLRSQMLLRAHSLHWLRLRPCSQHRCRRRTPCTRCVASRDNNSRCFCRRCPCRGSAAARARICWRYRTRRTGGGAARARRGGSFSAVSRPVSRPLSLPIHAILLISSRANRARSPTGMKRTP